MLLLHWIIPVINFYDYKRDVILGNDKEFEAMFCCDKKESYPYWSETRSKLKNTFRFLILKQ